MMPSPGNFAEFVALVIESYGPHRVFDFLARPALPGIEWVDGCDIRDAWQAKRWLTMAWHSATLAVRVPHGLRVAAMAGLYCAVGVVGDELPGYFFLIFQNLEPSSDRSFINP